MRKKRRETHRTSLSDTEWSIDTEEKVKKKS